MSRGSRGWAETEVNGPVCRLEWSIPARFFVTFGSSPSPFLPLPILSLRSLRRENGVGKVKVESDVVRDMEVVTPVPLVVLSLPITVRSRFSRLRRIGRRWERGKGHREAPFMRVPFVSRVPSFASRLVGPHLTHFTCHYIRFSSYNRVTP